MTRAKQGDPITVKIEKIVPKGLGIGFGEGITVFVPLTAPGDLVRARINKLKGNSAFCEVEEIIEPGPNRAVPPCPYFGACGGCDFQQFTYAAQLRAKVGIVRDCLERIGKFDDIGEIPIVASPRELGYRLRAEWHADTQTRAFGYFRRETHEVIDVEQCPIATPELNQALRDLRSELPWGEIWDDRIAIHAAHGDGEGISVFSNNLDVPTSEVAMKVSGEQYSFSAQTFFQGNKFLVDKLVELATAGSSGGQAIDLFSGVGLFTLPLARKFASVAAVESNDVAVKFAIGNAERAGLTNIEFVREEVENFLRSYRGQRPDLVVFDPPRAGTSKQTVLGIAELKPDLISYISCEPSILARDLSWLADAGYEIASITAVDLFPQTHHVETVVRLRAETRA